MNTMKVLMIEDDFEDARIIEAMLHGQGIDVDHAATLEKAIETIREVSYDALLLDLGLPESNGLETFLKIQEPASHIPIIVLTDLEDEETGIEAVRAGAQDYLMKKDMDSRLLRRSIRYAIERKSLEEELRDSNESLIRETEERRRTAEELRKKKAELEKMVEKNSDGMVIVSDKGRILHINSAGAEQLGKKREECLGCSYPLSVEDTGILEINPNDESGGEGFNTQVELNIQRTSWEGSGAYLMTIRDISRRKKAENALKISERRIETLLKNTPTGVVFFDAGNKILSANQAAADLFGYSSSDELRGLDSRDLFNMSGNRDEFLNKIYRNGNMKGEIALRRKDGKVVYILRSCSAERNGDGRVLGHACFCTEITERIEMEKKLEQICEANKDFAHEVSHELLNAFDSIEGYCRELMERFESGCFNGASVIVESVKEKNNQMRNLTEDLIRLSKIDEGRLNIQEVNLSELSEQLYFDVLSMNPARDITFKAQPDIVMNCDPGLMRTVLANLIVNAWKFTQSKNPAKIEFGVMDRDGGKVLYVRDNGAGFDMKEAEKIFIPFKRLNKEIKGTGLGLPMVKKIIERHDGNVWAESAKGEGATFYFTINV